MIIIIHCAVYETYTFYSDKYTLTLLQTSNSLRLSRGYSSIERLTFNVFNKSLV